MLSIMAHNRRRGWQVIFKISEIENMISPDYDLRYKPQALDIFGERMKIWTFK